MSTEARDARDRLAEWITGAKYIPEADWIRALIAGWDEAQAEIERLVERIETMHAAWMNALNERDEAQARLAQVEALRDEWAKGLGSRSDYDHGRWHRAAARMLGEALGGDKSARDHEAAEMMAAADGPFDDGSYDWEAPSDD